MAHSEHHSHAHNHAHIAVHANGKLNRAFKLGIWLNIIYVAVEGIFGILTDSMGLLSDAGHNLSALP